MTCGKVFPPRRADARFCAAACRQQAYRRRQRQQAEAATQPAPVALHGVQQPGRRPGAADA